MDITQAKDLLESVPVSIDSGHIFTASRRLRLLRTLLSVADDHVWRAILPDVVGVCDALRKGEIESCKERVSRALATIATSKPAAAKGD
jgi:hypothetical protein